MQPSNRNWLKIWKLVRFLLYDLNFEKKITSNWRFWGRCCFVYDNITVIKHFFIMLIRSKRRVPPNTSYDKTLDLTRKFSQWRKLLQKSCIKIILISMSMLKKNVFFILFPKSLFHPIIVLINVLKNNHVFFFFIKQNRNISMYRQALKHFLVNWTWIISYL